MRDSVVVEGMGRLSSRGFVGEELGVMEKEEERREERVGLRC